MPKLPAAAAMIYAGVTTPRVTSSKMRVTWYIGGQQIRLPLAGPAGRRDRAAYNTFLSIVERGPFVGTGTTLFRLEIVIDYRNPSDICGASSLWRIGDKSTSSCHY